MRAAVIREQGGNPIYGLFDPPTPRDGATVIDVTVAAIGPTDLMKAKGDFRPYPGPHVVNGEGVGLTPAGKRVYFGHSIVPYGACAERTLVSEDEVWSIPDDVSDEQAAAIGISGTGALVALEQAAITSDDNVLVLGATGALGQMALQILRTMGPRRIAAAGRNQTTLNRILNEGLADAVAQIGQGNDLAALSGIADSGFTVVFDIVFGPPAEAALHILKPGGRMISVGRLAGPTITLSLHDLGYKSIASVGTGLRAVAERQAAFGRLMRLAAYGLLSVKTREFTLDRALDAWEALSSSANAKVLLRP